VVAPNLRTAPVSLLSPRRAMRRRRMMLKPSAAANPWLNRANRGDGADPGGAATETGEGCPRSVILQSIGTPRWAAPTARGGQRCARPGRSSSIFAHRSAVAAVSSRRRQSQLVTPLSPLSGPPMREQEGPRGRQLPALRLARRVVCHTCRENPAPFLELAKAARGSLSRAPAPAFEVGWLPSEDDAVGRRQSAKEQSPENG
jgi:hypothetical protein